jgi:hypothetical protein
LTIELTPCRGRVTAALIRANLRINPPENNSLTLTRSRVALLKTLFLLEHLPESATYANSHVLGLVLNTLEAICSLMRLTAEKRTLQTRYPIYFVVKNRRPRVAAMAEPWGS